MRSFPLLRRVIDASIEGTCMILIGVRTDDGFNIHRIVIILLSLLLLQLLLLL